MTFKEFPVIVTERLILRKLEESDWESISYLRSDKNINQFIKRQNADTKEKAINFIKKTNLRFKNNQIIYWSISFKNKPKMIGSICLWNFSKDKKTAEIGYDLDSKYQNKGIMSESMKKVICFGFQELNLKKIEAFTHHQNKNSISLLLKNNFQEDKNRTDPDNLKNIILVVNRPAANNGSPQITGS